MLGSQDADTKIVYRRYASLFFIAGCDATDNELLALEIVHRYVEQMDKYYGNVCELDIIFNFQKAYAVRFCISKFHQKLMACRSWMNS